MKYKKPFIIGGLFLAVSALIILALSLFRYDFAVKMGGKVFQMEVADTDFLREKGLSEHNPLALNQGMIFIFDKPDIYKFWMKDMNFPLDIIWVSEDMRITHIERWLAPETYPKEYSSTLPSKYVIEVNAGVSDYLGLKIGDQVSFFRNRR